MMKRFYYGAMATGLLFAACSSDNLSEPGKDNGPADADKTLYVKMSIHGDVANGTRAGNTGDPVDGEPDFDSGEGESEVRNAYFVFYDENGKQVGDVVSITLTDPVTESTGETVEKYYKNVVPVSIKKNDLNPAQVICYINPISPAALQNPLQTIQTVTREEVKYENGGKTYFPMSNSVYYLNTDDGTTPQIAVPINEDTQLFDTEEEAKAATDGEAIDVYVERYASKLTFSVKQGASTTPYATATAEVGGEEVPVTLTWTPSKWALNAEANETYVVKSYRQPSATGQILPDHYTYGAANTALNESLTEANMWKWNNAAYHRSYWACSPAYFTEKYPEVASDVNSSYLHQKYYTYQEVMTGDKGYVQSSTTPQYFRETTVGSAALQGGNPQAAVPSVIFVGSYELSLDGTKITVGEGDNQDNPSFYTYIPGSNGNALVFFDNKANSADSQIDGGVSMLKRFIQQTTVLFTKEGTEEKPNYVSLDTSNPTVMQNLVASMAVVRPSDAVLAPGETVEGEPMKVPARQRTLQIQSLTSMAGIYIATGSGYKAIVADNAANIDSNTQIKLTDANRILMQQVGFANYYQNGHSYYNIPVKHYGWYRPGNPNRTNGVDNAGIDWGKVMVGDFGMVRNHSYSIEVNSIKGLATGIGGTEPIVPPADTRDYYIAYKVRILKWAVVPQQNVDL